MDEDEKIITFLFLTLGNEVNKIITEKIIEEEIKIDYFIHTNEENSRELSQLAMSITGFNDGALKREEINFKEKISTNDWIKKLSNSIITEKKGKEICILIATCHMVDIENLTEEAGWGITNLIRYTTRINNGDITINHPEILTAA